MPHERIGQTPLIDSGIHFGFFPAFKITDRRERSFQYIFASTPQFEDDPRKDVFEKARMIVSCIRHGQFHADGTAILYPRCILMSMRHNVMKPHPNANVEYILLKLNGIVDLIPERSSYGNAYRVVWIDSPENNLAADLADALLKGQEPSCKSSEDVEVSKWYHN